MRKRMKVLIFTMVFVMTLGMTGMPLQAKNYPLKRSNITWDLKKKKKVKYKTRYEMLTHGTKSVAKYKVGKVAIKKFKTSISAKYKTVSFTVVFNLPNKFSKKEIDGINEVLSAAGYYGGNMYVAVADYKTGYALASNNKANVKVKFGQFKYSGLKKFLGTHGGSMKFYTKATIKVTVKYPKSYKNACVLAGGYANADPDCKNNDTAFFKGKIPFRKCKSLYSKKYKTINHGMRLK